METEFRIEYNVMYQFNCPHKIAWNKSKKIYVELETLFQNGSQSHAMHIYLSNKKYSTWIFLELFYG